MWNLWYDQWIQQSQKLYMKGKSCYVIRCDQNIYPCVNQQPNTLVMHFEISPVSFICRKKRIKKKLLQQHDCFSFPCLARWIHLAGKFKVIVQGLFVSYVHMFRAFVLPAHWISNHVPMIVQLRLEQLMFCLKHSKIPLSFFAFVDFTLGDKFPSFLVVHDAHGTQSAIYTKAAQNTKDFDDTEETKQPSTLAWSKYLSVSWKSTFVIPVCLFSLSLWAFKNQTWFKSADLCIYPIENVRCSFEWAHIKENSGGMCQAQPVCGAGFVNCACSQPCGFMTTGLSVSLAWLWITCWCCLSLLGTFLVSLCDALPCVALHSFCPVLWTSCVWKQQR